MDPSESQNVNDPRDGQRAVAIAGDVWFNAIIGVVLIALGFTFARFIAAKLSGQPFHTNVNWTDGPNAGNEVPYFDLQGMTAWTDMGVFLFGIVILLEAAATAAIALRPGTFSKGLLSVALVLTVGATALNIYICIRMFQIGLTPLLSGLAVAFGGWILANEWRMLRAKI